MTNDWPDDRDCIEVLMCPGCGAGDVDFELVDYRLVRCSLCRAVVRVTDYKAGIGPPGDPTDHVLYIGVVHSAAR